MMEAEAVVENRMVEKGNSGGDNDSKTFDGGDIAKGSGGEIVQGSEGAVLGGGGESRTRNRTNSANRLPSIFTACFKDDSYFNFGNTTVEEEEPPPPLPTGNDGAIRGNFRGSLSKPGKRFNLVTYSWPTKQKPKGIILCFHGYSVHCRWEFSGHHPTGDSCSYEGGFAKVNCTYLLFSSLFSISGLLTYALLSSSTLLS
jgi:hypothetical protein